jgi:hypothetical protein
VEKDSAGSRRALRFDADAVDSGIEGRRDLDRRQRTAGPLFREPEPRTVDREDAQPIDEKQGRRRTGNAGEREIAPGEEVDRLRLFDIDRKPDPAGASGLEVGAVPQGARTGKSRRGRDDQENEQEGGRGDRALEENASDFFHQSSRRVAIAP